MACSTNSSAEKLERLAALSQKYDDYYGQLADAVVVNDSVQEAVSHLHDVVIDARTNPQWIPASWASAEVGKRRA